VAVFGSYYLLLLGASVQFDSGWLFIAVAALPFVGIYTALFDDRLHRITRRTRSFLRFWREPERHAELVKESRQLAEQLREFVEGRRPDPAAAAPDGTPPTSP
jgi:hypothetical protein